MQNGRYTNIDNVVIVMRIVNFQVNNVPNVARMFLSTIESGIPPSKIPCGQMYLQKYGNAIPALFVIMIGSNITATARIINFVYVKNLNFFVLNFFVGILCNKS